MSRRTLVQDARLFSIGWRLWFWLLQLINGLGPLIFIGHLEARLTLVAYILAAVAVIAMHKRFGWVRLLGAGHLPLLLLVPWLIYRYAATQPEGVFAVWLLLAICVNAVCVAIDATDVIRYALGDREPVPPREKTDSAVETTAEKAKGKTTE